MMKGKELKKKGRAVLKSHYLLLTVICFIAAVIGSNFGESARELKGLVTGTVTEADAGSTEPESLEEAETESLVAAEVEANVAASTGILSSGLSGYEVLIACLRDGLERGSALAEAIMEKETQNAANPALGRTRGVMAKVVNTVSSGAVWVIVISGVRNVLHSETAAAALAVIAAFFLYLFFLVFIRDLYGAVLCRFFLEARTYEHVPYTRLLYFQHVKRWARASLAMALKGLLHALWCLTIVGGFVKYFSYYMVPWIVAENPDIMPMEAITLSRRMMDGHKWDCFLKKLSFLGWGILDALTSGLSGVLFSNAYESAAFTEYYVWLRGLAREKRIPGSERFCDRYLYEKADPGKLERAYAAEKREMDRSAAPKLGRAVAIAADWFGVVLRRTPAVRAYEAYADRRNQERETAFILQGKAYPGRLSFFPDEQKNKRVESIRYDRSYTVTVIFSLFLLFSFVGWIWEGTLHLLEAGTFINRGVLHGPWIPIYGTGCVLVLLLLKKLRSRPVVHFLATVLLCGCVEYFTGLALETAHGGQKWWDYSGYFLNLHGRVCFEGLLIFGVGGSLVVYLAAPAIDGILRRVPVKILVPVVAVLMSIYFVDNFYSSSHPNTGHGVTDIALLEEVPGHSVTDIALPEETPGYGVTDIALPEETPGYGLPADGAAKIWEIA